MSDFWDDKFGSDGIAWGMEPADSARHAVEIFRYHGLSKILVPGFGYGRNAKLFIDNGFDVTGIEISAKAIELAREQGMNCTVHHGPVQSMPFDNEKFDAIYCYALLHLLNKHERKRFLETCYGQLLNGGMMLFAVVSKQSDLFGRGRKIGTDRYRIGNRPGVFFYDFSSVEKEFNGFGLTINEYYEEPIRFMNDQPPMKMMFILCKK